MIASDRIGSRRVPATTVARLAGILSLAVLLAGCDLLQTALQGANPFASPSPSALGPAPDSWTVIELTKPRLQLEIPTTWQQISTSTIEDQLKSALPSLTGDIAKAWQFELNLIDRGQAVDFFQGSSADSTYTATIEVDVFVNDDSLAAAVSREDSTDDGLFGPPDTRAEEPVSLAIGPAIREITTSTPSGGSPSQGVAYILRLDGSTVLVGGSAPADDPTFVGLMAHVAASLRQP